MRPDFVLLKLYAPRTRASAVRMDAPGVFAASFRGGNTGVASCDLPRAVFSHGIQGCGGSLRG